MKRHNVSNPLMLSLDQTGLDDFEVSYTHNNSQLYDSKEMGIGSNTTRHDRSRMSAGVDLLKVLRNPQNTLQRPQQKMSDPKVLDFFKKMNENGIQSLKGQLLFSTSNDGFSGQKFHQKCDKKSPIIVMLVLDNGFKIGGFTYKGIDPKSIEVVDNLAGMFCTYDCKKFDFYSVNNNKLVYHPNGITFGSPTNFSLPLDAIGNLVCNLEIGYYDPNGKKVLFSLTDRRELTKLIKEVCVYLLK